MFTRLLTIVMLLTLCLPQRNYAQQDAQFSQYIFNGIYINPAYAGYRQELNAHAFYRSQWVGIPGAPQTMSIAIDGSTNNDRVGLALQMAYDKIGAQNTFSAYGNYAYRIPLGRDETSRLAFGIGVGIIQVGLDGSLLDPNNVNDPYLTGTKLSARMFDARAGIYYSTDVFYAGFSVDNITAQYMGRNKPSILDVPTPKPHYYLTAGGMIRLNEDVYLKPSFLLKDDRGGPTSLDLNAFLLLKETLWVGAGYRTAIDLYNKPNLQRSLTKSSAVIGMAEVFITPQLRLGYAYDYALNRFRTYNNGTHEISLGYYFRRSPEKKRTSLQQMRCFYF